MFGDVFLITQVGTLNAGTACGASLFDTDGEGGSRFEASVRLSAAERDWT
jgi:hypothetical protein